MSHSYFFDGHLKIACSHRRTKSSLTLHCTTVHACDVFSALTFSLNIGLKCSKVKSDRHGRGSEKRNEFTIQFQHIGRLNNEAVTPSTAHPLSVQFLLVQLSLENLLYVPSICNALPADSKSIPNMTELDQ
jgi:hypothetical protein